MNKNVTKLQSGCFVKHGEYSGLKLYSMDRNAWYSSEERAISIHAKKAEIATISVVALWFGAS
jgi:hypothetical protein